MGITALIAGGVGAAGSIGSAFIGANASKNASNAQVQEQQLALAQQQKMFNIAQGNLQPFVDAGKSVLPTLQGLITPGPNQNALLSQTPGFQFNLQYGNKATTNALAAKGQGASAGPLGVALSQYNQGLAGNTWQSVVNALQNYGNLGANAAGNLAGGAISSGNSQASTLTGIGQAQGAGILGSANALSGGLTGASNAGTNALLYNQLFKNSGSGDGAAGIYDANPGTAANPLPGLTSSDYAAEGGHTSGKGTRPIIVGENGPELFVPDGAGTIVPYHRLKHAIEEKNCLTTRGLSRKLGRAA